jgi:hypothetical protein
MSTGITYQVNAKDGFGYKPFLLRKLIFLIVYEKLGLKKSNYFLVYRFLKRRKK